MRDKCRSTPSRTFLFPFRSLPPSIHPILTSLHFYITSSRKPNSADWQNLLCNPIFFFFLSNRAFQKIIIPVLKILVPIFSLFPPIFKQKENFQILTNLCLSIRRKLTIYLLIILFNRYRGKVLLSPLITVLCFYRYHTLYLFKSFLFTLLYTHTHTHRYVYIYYSNWIISAINYSSNILNNRKEEEEEERWN